MVQKNKNKDMNKRTNENNKDKGGERGEYYSFSSLGRYFEEPILGASILVFLLTVIKNVIGSSRLGIINTGAGKVSIYFIGSVLFGFLCIYFIYIYLKRTTRGYKEKYKLVFVVILIFSISVFIWYSDQGGSIDRRDFNVLSVVFATFLILYAFTLQKIMKISTAMITAIFLSTLLTHVIPAQTIRGVEWTGKYLAALDPYFYYRHANTIVNTGFVPERETLAYPTDMPSFADRRFMASVFMGSMSVILKVMGISTHDIAMVYGGIFAALSTIVLYLLIRDLFHEYEPYNKAAAILAAFMLMFSPAFAAKAIASNCEDDALGMFLLISSFFLFITSYRKRSIRLSLIAGFSFLLLNLSWAGYNFALLILLVFIVAHSFINFIQDIYSYIFYKRDMDKKYTDYLPYLVIPVIIGNLSFLILHTQGEIPVFDIESIPKYNIILTCGAIFLPIIFETIRVRISGRIIIDKRGDIETIINNFIQKNIYIIFGIIIFSGIIFLIFFMDPLSIINYAFYVITGAKVRDIIGMTTAEQNPLCSKILSEKCLSSMYSTFGISILFAFFSIFILIYYAFSSKKNIGPIFVLCWSIPAIWIVVNKSQFQFIASVPIIALGSTFALLIVMRMREWETLRIIPTILLIILPLVFTIGTDTPLVGAFGGRLPIDMGTKTGDIIYWYPALKWIGQQPENTTILTWWDYGHWITSISNRTSIADNTKARKFIVQDLAKFHVLEENETKALMIAKKYNATHVVIDYTMIGKSAAPHFIATSNLTAPYTDPNREGEHMGYGTCTFSPRDSSLEPKYVSVQGEGFIKKRDIVFVCNVGGNPEDYIAAINFEIVGDENKLKISDIKVRPIIRVNNELRADTWVSWRVWQSKEHSSILGIHPPSLIISNAIAYKDDPEKHINFPTYRIFVYVPEKFNNYMMTRLYLGDYLEEYQEFGLADSSIRPLKHFELVDEFKGTNWMDFATGKDKSFLGYVKVWKINYPENITAYS